MTLLNSLTLSETKDNGAQSLENSNGNFPAPQDFRNMDADFGLSNYHQPYNNTTSFVWALPFGEGKRWLSSPSPVVNALVGGWELAGINSVYAGEPVTFIYNARRDVRRLRHRAGLPRRQQLPAERDLRSDGRGRERTINNWFNRACVALPTDPSQPFGNAERNSVRGPKFWQLDLVASKRVALGGPAQFELAHRGVQRAEPDELPRAERQPQRRRVRHHHLDLRSAPAAAGVQGPVVARAVLVLLALARVSSHPRKRRSSSRTAAPAVIGPSTRSRPIAWPSRWARTSSSPISSRRKTAC